MKSLLKTLSLGLFFAVNAASPASASQIATQWYHGWWDCSIDGRPATMVWEVRDASTQVCHDGVCSQTSGVKTVGFFRENTTQAWTQLERTNNTADSANLFIRYLGAEPANWLLQINPSTISARGYTTWHGARYPLSCSNRRR